MDAGKLRKRITFEAPTSSRDAYGQDVPTWSAVATVWAQIRPLSGRQLALAQARTITATATDQIVIRFRDDIKIGYHRIRYGAGPEAATPSLTYETLTAGQYTTLTDGDDTGETEPDPRIFTINDIEDTDESHRQLVLTVTEVKA